MVKKLAIKGAAKMGKMIVFAPRGFSAVLFVFALSVALDFEFAIASIAGSGEVLGQSSILVGDALHKVYEVPVPIKLLDVVTLILTILLISRRKIIFSEIKSAYENNAWRWLLFIVGLFYFWAAISILVNVQEYTEPQLLIMGLHLVKLIQVTLVGVIMALLVRENPIHEISGPLLLGFLLASGVLILNKLGWIVIGTAAGDRMETFGGIIIGIAMIFHFHRAETREGEVSALKQLLYVATVIVATIAILTSGKRGITVVYLACIPFFLLSGLFSSKTIRRNLQYALLVGFIFSLPNIASDYQSTFEQPYNALHGTVYRNEIVSLYEKFGSKPAEGRPYWKTEEYRVPFVSNLDYSGAERIGKFIKTIKLSVENLWSGSGFWGVQYKYEFLPDTSLQVLLETGLIGAALLLLMLYWFWHGTAESRFHENGHATAHILVVLVALTILGVFCNPFYMSRLVMMWMFIAFLFVYPRKLARGRVILPQVSGGVK
jgi:hypothetical protein